MWMLAQAAQHLSEGGSAQNAARAPVEAHAPSLARAPSGGSHAPPIADSPGALQARGAAGGQLPVGNLGGNGNDASGATQAAAQLRYTPNPCSVTPETNPLTVTQMLQGYFTQMHPPGP